MDSVHCDISTGDRVFHSICGSRGSFDIFASFGRSNPSKVFDSIIKISLDESWPAPDKPQISVSMNQVPVVNVNQEVLERFRHGSVLFDNDSKLFFYGGKRSEGNLSSSIILNAAFVFYIINVQLVKLKVNWEELSSFNGSLSSLNTSRWSWTRIWSWLAIVTAFVCGGTLSS